MSKNSSSRKKWWKRKMPTSESWKTTSITFLCASWRRPRAFYGHPMNQKRRLVNLAKSNKTTVDTEWRFTAEGVEKQEWWDWSKPNFWLSYALQHSFISMCRFSRGWVHVIQFALFVGQKFTSNLSTLELF